MTASPFATRSQTRYDHSTATQAHPPCQGPPEVPRRIQITFCVHGVISCVLANIYLHYTLDLWFEKRFKPQCQGEAHLVRFVDDFVVSFQYLADAEAFQGQLRERFARFNLALAEEKTRLLLFGRFAAERRANYGQRPETFEFLGFKHVCGTDRGGRFAVVRLPSEKSCRKFLARTHEWLVQHMHWRRRDQQRHLQIMLRGFYQYFGLHHCQEK